MGLGHHRRGGYAATSIARVCASLTEAEAKFADTWRARVRSGDHDAAQLSLPNAPSDGRLRHRPVFRACL